MSEAAAEADQAVITLPDGVLDKPAATTETKPAEAPKAAEWDGKVESLPAAAQKVIADLRKEAGDERVAKKTLDAITKALNPDAAGEKPDPAKLATQLSEQQTEARQAKIELAIYKEATKPSVGVDAAALLDSRSFLAKIADLDPTDAKAITKAITEAVNDNPKFKLVQAASASGSDFSGGSGEGAITQEKFNSMTPSEKNALYNTNPAAYRKLTGR